METKKEEKGFSLGRLDIVDLYEWKSQEKLVYQTYFQRQFVWKEKDKVDLIDTIMQELPIPAVFICDARTDFASLSKTYNVLDGRQRLESIFEFLENKYQYKGKFFKDMDEIEKKKILNYNITLIQMYVEPNDTEKIKEIFKRLNKNSYNLNRIEKQSTQLVEYDYMIIAKIVSGIIQFENIDTYLEEIQELFEEDIKEDIESGEISDCFEEVNIATDIREICCYDNINYITEILTKDYVFKQYDRRRQIALQYFLNVFSCVIKKELINRNVTERMIKELSSVSKDIIADKLICCNKVCRCLIEIYKTEIDEFWRNKTSFFSLFYVLATEENILDKKSISQIKDCLIDFQETESKEWEQYYLASSQGVNDKKVRETRNEILIKILN